MLRRRVQYKYRLPYPYRVTPRTSPFTQGVFDYMTLKIFKRMGKNQERKEHTTYNRTKDGQLGWSHLA